MERASSAMSVVERDSVGLMASDPRPSQRFATPSRCKSPHPLTAARAVLPLLYLVHCLVSIVIALLIGNRPQPQVVADVYLMRVQKISLLNILLLVPWYTALQGCELDVYSTFLCHLCPVSARLPKSMKIKPWARAAAEHQVVWNEP